MYSEQAAAWVKTVGRYVLPSGVRPSQFVSLTHVPLAQHEVCPTKYVCSRFPRALCHATYRSHADSRRSVYRALDKVDHELAKKTFLASAKLLHPIARQLVARVSYPDRAKAFNFQRRADLPKLCRISAWKSNGCLASSRPRFGFWDRRCKVRMADIACGRCACGEVS